jgi:hypothetical protein
MTDCLELTDDQFKRLPVSQKLDVLYVNVRAIATIRRTQKMQWLMIGSLWTGFAGFGAWVIDKLLK